MRREDREGGEPAGECYFYFMQQCERSLLADETASSLTIKHRNKNRASSLPSAKNMSIDNAVSFALLFSIPRNSDLNLSVDNKTFTGFNLRRDNSVVHVGREGLVSNHCCYGLFQLYAEIL